MHHAHARRYLPFVLLALATAGAGPCGGGSTAKSQPQCSRDADCGYGKYCGAGSCQRFTWFCATPSVSMNERGEHLDCDVYACDANTGRCLSSSTNSGECSNGALWDPISYTCICPVNTPCGGSAAPPAYSLAGYRTCAVDADCGASEMCWRSPWVQSPTPVCVPRSVYCGFDATGAVTISPGSTFDGAGNLVRTATSCGLYQCDPVSGACLDYCTGTGECQGGASCLITAGGPNYSSINNQVCATALR